MGRPPVSQVLLWRNLQVPIISTSPLYLPHLSFNYMHSSTAPTQVSSSTRVPHATSSLNTSSSQSRTHPLLFHIPSPSSSPTQDPLHAHTFCTMHASPLTRSLFMILSMFFPWKVRMLCLGSRGSTKTTPTLIGNQLHGYQDPQPRALPCWKQNDRVYVRILDQDLHYHPDLASTLQGLSVDTLFDLIGQE